MNIIEIDQSRESGVRGSGKDIQTPIMAEDTVGLLEQGGNRREYNRIVETGSAREAR